MYCPKCGAENRDDAKICASCSSALSTVSAIPPTPVAKTSGLAIASLVLAILSPFTCFITAIPAIVLGIVGLCKINKSAGQLKGQGLAIAGICVPAFALPIVATTLIGILMPALVRTRQITHRMICATNMSSLGKAMLIYAGDYDEKFPIPSKWCDLLTEYVDVAEKQFRCKGAPEGPCNYAMNKNVEKLGTSSVPPDMVLLFETDPGWNQHGGPEMLTTENHAGHGCNILFVDGHVEFIGTQHLDDLKWKPE